MGLREFLDNRGYFSPDCGTTARIADVPLIAELREVIAELSTGIAEVWTIIAEVCTSIAELSGIAGVLIGIAEFPG
ncbi:MAG TPA: hypothetical protein VIG80_09220 [Bacillaceae bacterium]